VCVGNRALGACIQIFVRNLQHFDDCVSSESVRVIGDGRTHRRPVGEPVLASSWDFRVEQIAVFFCWVTARRVHSPVAGMFEHSPRIADDEHRPHGFCPLALADRFCDAQIDDRDLTFSTATLLSRLSCHDRGRGE